jgi:2'-5' RNA ligase
MDLFLEKEGGTYKFSCLMWNLSGFYKDLTIAWGNKNIPDSVLYNDPDDDTLGREDCPHITLKYGIHSHDPKEVEKVISGFGGFLVEFGKISKFEKKGKYDVIKMEVEGRKLRELNALVSDNLECTDSYKDYNPHITVAYVIPGSCDHLLGKYIFRDSVVKATQLVFSIPNEEKEKVLITL